jgi:hypothetical protein
MKQLYTQHTMKVEAKGSGPSILTAGGLWTRHDGGKEFRMMTQAVGSGGVKVGEEIPAFLRAEPDGFSFVEWDGTKYPIMTDAQTGERSVALRLCKRKYMRAENLHAFRRLASMETGPDPAAQIEAKLAGFRLDRRARSQVEDGGNRTRRGRASISTRIR